MKIAIRNLEKINPGLSYKNNDLYLEDVRLLDIVKKEGTTFYAYGLKTLTENVSSYLSEGFKVCYSAKANSNHSILKHLVKLGCGIDIVSGGELYRALKAGTDPKKIVYSGVCKTESELEFALKSGILMINVESESEIRTINEISKKLKMVAEIAIRINPGVDPKTHPYISTGFRKNKFGISEENAQRIINNLSIYPNVRLLGIDCHIGSQLLSLEPFTEAMDKIVSFIDENKLDIEYVDLGGGVGITYCDEKPPKISDYAAIVKNKFKKHKIIVEPGRSIVGNAGVIVGKIHYIKDNGTRKFYMSDIGMNELVRPSLYNARHLIVPLTKKDAYEKVDLVGPICESADVLIEQAELSKMEEGDYFAVLSAGAYGFSMASNYNSHPRPAEIIVENSNYSVVRERETYEDLLRGEVI